MNTFAFRSKRVVVSAWMRMLEHYQRHNTLMDLVKVGALMVAIIFFFLLYLVYVNLASTRGYFLRQAMQERDGAAFEYEIVKTQLLKVQQYNREKTDSNTMAQNANSVIINLPPN